MKTLTHLFTRKASEILRSRADTPDTKDLKGAGSAIHSLRPLQTLRIGNSPKNHHYLKSRELWLNAMSRSPNLRSSTARSGQKRLLMFSNSSLRRQTKQSWPSGLVPAAHFTTSRVPYSGNGFTLIKMIFRLVRDGRGLSLHLSVPDQRVAGSLISSSELHSTKTITKRPKLLHGYVAGSPGTRIRHLILDSKPFTPRNTANITNQKLELSSPWVLRTFHDFFWFTLVRRTSLPRFFGADRQT